MVAPSLLKWSSFAIALVETAQLCFFVLLDNLGWGKAEEMEAEEESAFWEGAKHLRSLRGAVAEREESLAAIMAAMGCFCNWANSLCLREREGERETLNSTAQANVSDSD